ncbi:hypothetical protein AMTR_s00024p00234280 [Amborella trichopoda]|uniref:Chalcone isomerase domain-containing protein n=2 Tax=Amborella trichopoda TaxID=13333 RepID=W1PT95_AMBTC|nr:hypothetical protein AMTR_s00024p00234280 [Amborella trichopoda]
MDILLSQGLGDQFWSEISSFVDISHNSCHFKVPGSLAIQEALTRISKFAGALLLSLSRGSNSSSNRKLSGPSHGSKHINLRSNTKLEHTTSFGGKLARFQSRSRLVESGHRFFGKIASCSLKHLWNDMEQLRAFPIMSIAAAIVPPVDYLSVNKVLPIPLDSTHGEDYATDQLQCEVGQHLGSSVFSIPKRNWTCVNNAVEPRTGIKFPLFLENILSVNNNSSWSPLVLVGIGSRSMKIIKFKSLKVYAFGLYVHPDCVCKKLAPKYASVPIDELKNREDFLDDLLREDIHMTIRLVVNCRGLKINTVRDAFEQSLRNRLLKMNPEADNGCLAAFGSCFAPDIPLSVGTTIDFQQTPQGQLITEIGGKQLGAVQSKDLCKAFFSMYIGELPVSVQAKQEISNNIADMIKRF